MPVESERPAPSACGSTMRSASAMTSAGENSATLHDEEFSPADVIAEALRMVEPQAEGAGLSLSTGIAPNLPRLNADRRLVRQVLVNLLANAVRFTPA